MSSKNLVSVVLSTLLRCFDTQESKNPVNQQNHSSSMADEPDRPFSYADALTGGADASTVDPVYESPAVEVEEEQSNYIPTDDVPTSDHGYAIESALEEAGDSPLKAASQLWKLDDANRLEPGVDYQVNTQLKARSYSEDCADEPFIQFISDDVWERPTYRTFKQLLNNYVAETGIPERVEQEETEEENAFLDAVIATPVGQFTRHWLDTYCDTVDVGDDEAFKAVLRRLWFELYARNTGGDSCGFEHAFIGELDDGAVKGLHNFIQVYVEEARGNFDYRGFLEYGRIRGDVADHDRLLTIRFKWLGSLKPASTMFVGVSPEFEICLYSLLWLTGARGGTVELGPYDVRVKVYDMHGCVGAAFPELTGLDYENPDAYVD